MPEGVPVELGVGVPVGVPVGVSEGGGTTSPSRLNPKAAEFAVQAPVANLKLHGSAHGAACRNTDQVHKEVPTLEFHFIELDAPEITRA